MQNSHWRNSQHKANEMGCGFSIFSTLLILGMVYAVPFRFRVILLIGAYAIIYIVVDAVRRNNANSVEKVYNVKIYEATQIVENILNAKHFPFRRENNGEKVKFHLDENDVELLLSPFSYHRRAFQRSLKIASLVKIRSKNVDDDLLVQNLKGKLDDGFAPKGL